jgi:dTDP-4-dehydrorhamnose reductase
MTVLIIGSQGALGQQLVKVYNDLQPVVWSKDDLDVTNEQAVWDKIAQLKPDLVFNCAAVSDYDVAESDRLAAESVNGYGAGNVAKACESVGATVVYFSCVSVFDGSKTDGYNEDDSTGPINALGRGKVVGEMETLSNCDAAYIIRTSWLFGDKTFIELWAKAADKAEPIKAADDEIGNPTYLLDLAQASRALVEEKKEFGVYHIFNTGSVSRFDFANQFLVMSESQSKAVAVKKDAESLMAHRPQYQILNNTKFLELRPWREALQEYVLLKQN